MKSVVQNRSSRSRRVRAFTLIELMVVVAIIGLVAVFSIPAIREATHREALSQAVRDVSEACSRARARAILSGTPAEIFIHTADRLIEVRDAPQDTNPVDQLINPGPSSPDKPAAKSSDKPPGFSARISDDLMIDMIDVNLVEYKDEPEAHVRFFPNGTSDEFTLILHSAGGEYRKIWLEVVTATADFGPLSK